MIDNEILKGYLHPDYADSLAEFGHPRELSACGGWVLVRPIPDFDARDAMGCYPLFVCQDFMKIHDDLEKLKNDLVSLVLVTDPFADIEPQYLMEHFDLAKPFKRHLITTLHNNLELSINKHHRYYARKSLRDLDVEIVAQPEEMLDAWCELYQNLIARHNITGIQAFSRACFERQLRLPGLVMIAGRVKSTNEVVGIHLVINQGEFSYSHLAAFSENGYKISAAYGIYWETLNYLKATNCQYFDLGAMPGLQDDSGDGLSRFKKGWSDNSRLVYLCGKIFNMGQMDLLIKNNSSITKADYFPPYRAS
jgi:hypothetical protein